MFKFCECCEREAYFQIDNDYLVIDFTTPDKEVNFQNYLIYKKLRDMAAAVGSYITWKEIDETVTEIRKAKIHFI